MKCHARCCSLLRRLLLHPKIMEIAWSRLYVETINLKRFQEIKSGCRCGGNLKWITLCPSTIERFISFFFFEFHSLGMSWLSSHITSEQIVSPIMFECLKALVVGLGGGVCEENFPCNSNIIVSNRKLTRRMRSTKEHLWNIFNKNMIDSWYC